MRPLLRVAVATLVTAGALTVTVGPASATSSYKVTASSSRTTLEPGQGTRISGKVTGGKVTGKKVTLYWTSAVKDEPWHRIGTAKLSRSGTYSRTFTPKAAGPTIVRVVKAAGSGHGKGSISTGAFDVFRWQPLAAYREPSTVHYGTGTVHGKAFPGSLLVTNGPTAPTFTTSAGECKAFAARVGLDQGSAASSATLAPSDGFLAFLFTIGVTKDRDVVGVSASLDPTRDLAMLNEFSTTDASNRIVVAGGQVLCNHPL